MEVNFNPADAAERHYAQTPICDHCDSEMFETPVITEAGQFHEHCYVALYVRPCASCGAEIDLSREGSDSVEGGPRCWKCLRNLADETPEVCECEMDSPCVHHQAQFALEVGQYDFERAGR